MKVKHRLGALAAGAALAAGLVVAGGPAAAKPTLLGSFNTGLELVGIAVDPATGNLFVYPAFGPDIIEFTPSGTEVTPRIPRPGVSSNDFDLDFALEALTIGGVTVPAGSLLVVNSDTDPEVLFGLNKDDGSVLGSRNLAQGTRTVGGAQHPGRDSVFVVSWTTDELIEINPNDASELNRFTINPSGAPGFDVFFGDVDVNPITGNLFVVGDGQTRIRELTPSGKFVRDYDVGSLGIGSMSGIAIDADGNAWIATRGGVAYHVGGIFEDAPPPECQSDPDAICGGPGDEDLQGTPEDDFIFAGGGNDTIDGGGGNDVIIGGSGADELSGGGGDDDLSGGTGKDLLVGDANTTGRMAAEGGEDTLDGGAGADEILGQAGDDTLNGGTGDDLLKGGSGANRFTGGPGKDTCVLADKRDTTSSCEIKRKKFRRNF